MVPPLPPCWFCTTYSCFTVLKEFDSLAGSYLALLATTGGNHSHNQVSKGVLEVFQWIAACFTHDKDGLRNMLTGGAVFEQIRAGAIDVMFKLQVSHGDFTDPRPLPACMVDS